MAKKRTAFTNRAWNLLRLALFWARKGGIFKKGTILDLFKRLRSPPSDSIYYGEREFSFDETPLFHSKMQWPSSMRFRYLPHIPCINPSIDFNDDLDHDGYNNGSYDREDGSSYFRRDVDGGDRNDRSGDRDGGGGDGLNGGDEGIDSKAEEFIARFYEQMKLQRQVSYLEYNEMLHRSTS
ncbi:uncharacterized protein LOC131226027 [Magnolia sinica]|uniref:uncharacterized protein LOC131226027 n=1 Tax=Magnolia sinica TaxID=86752 RepID=UPI0026599BCE|nr:uncharacterized protein LOC131226027 [Magnolia sinica]